MKPPLRWVSRVARKPKFLKVRVYESLPKPLKGLGKVENRKRYLFYISEKMKASRQV